MAGGRLCRTLMGRRGRSGLSWLAGGPRGLCLRRVRHGRCVRRGRLRRLGRRGREVGQVLPAQVTRRTDRGIVMVRGRMIEGGCRWEPRVWRMGSAYAVAGESADACRKAADTGSPSGKIGTVACLAVTEATRRSRSSLGVIEEPALVIVNAVYFRADWGSQFDKDSTLARPFHTDASTTKNTLLMHQQSVLPYSENEHLKFLDIPYIPDLAEE